MKTAKEQGLFGKKNAPRLRAEFCPNGAKFHTCEVSSMFPVGEAAG